MSPLQTQYPLSPRKFWKKMIAGTFGWLIVLFFLEVFPVVFWMLASETASDNTSSQGIFGFAALAIPVVIVLILVIQALYYKAYIRRYYYSEDDNFITIKKGVFAPAEIHVQYPKIQDVYVDQDILDRIMGLYDVHIASATASSAMEAHIDGVDQAAAEGLKTLFLEKLKGGGTPPQGGVAPQVPSGPVVLSEAVSSNNYPLSGAWVAQSVISYLISSLFVSVLLTFYITSSGSDSTGSITDMVGVSGFAVWLGIFVVVFIFHIIYMFIWKSVFYFEFLPEYILMRTGVISRSEVHVPYRAVQDVNVKQGVIERMFGLATVTIENAAAAQMVGKRLVKSGVIIPGQALEKANHIAEIVRGITLTKNTAQTGL